RRIDAYQLASVIGVVADEPGYVLFCLWIEHLAEREEVFLADAEGKLTHGIAEEARQIALQIPQRVDAKPVHVVTGDHVLVGPNQKALKVSVCSEQLLQRTEIAHRIIASLLWVSLPAKEFVLLDFARPDDGVSRRIRDAFDDGELWSGHSALVPPPNGLRTIAVASLRPLFVLTQPIVLVAQIC